MLRRKANKYIAMVLSVVMLVTLMPVQAWGAEKRDDVAVYFGSTNTTIGNLSYEAGNAIANFDPDRSATPGFSSVLSSHFRRGDAIWSGGYLPIGSTAQSGSDNPANNARVELTINVAQNKTLRELAASGHAKVLVGYEELFFHEGGIWPAEWERHSTAEFIVDDTRILFGSTTNGNRNQGPGSGSVVITPNSVIKIIVTGGRRTNDESPSGASGVFVKFEDKVRPKLEGYTFTGNGNERYNEKADRRELYVKQQENITLAYNFSELVRPSLVTPAYNDHFLRHPLFENVEGTGLPAAGQQMYLTNQTYTANTLTQLHKDVVYRYTGSRYHNSGNNDLQPEMTGEISGVSPIDYSMQQKITDAVFVDAAGNAALPDFPLKASLDSNSYLQGRTLNPFDHEKGGYYVIVDGVAPKYTKTGNGITPEIVTGVTLNNHDFFDFTIKFTEEAMIREGWNVNETFIHLNNGMKAGYTGGENTDTWTFRLNITDELIQETPLLKVIALTNESKPGYTDKDVISDYAGNLLIQPANLLGEHTDGDTSLVNSTIDWAQLAIDHTPPEIGFRFEADGATASLYKKNGKVTIDANDPTIKIPHLDPLVDIRGEERPSQGIYRPSNMTGASSPSVGLVYYYWSQSPDDPFLGKNDNWAAVKRYSLSAKQPSEELYKTGFEHVQLQVANNKTNMIAPPTEALTPEGSGIWYLHSWTADMTWDSARELMQYEKKVEFVAENPQQYEAWKAELTSGSEADRIFHADNKALAAVGQYGDVKIWPLEDFQHEDSNWTYNKTQFRLDNKGPLVTFDEYAGDGTMNVQLTTEVSDPHSGVGQVQYQWVSAGTQPVAIDWKNAPMAGGKFTVGTLNEVFEDGQYELYVKAIDLAGNTTLQATSKVAVVNSASSVTAGFDPDSNENYTQSHDIRFWISGIAPDKVAYVFTNSSSRPQSEAAYAELTELPAALEVGIESFGGGAGEQGEQEAATGEDALTEKPAGGDTVQPVGGDTEQPTSEGETEQSADEESPDASSLDAEQEAFTTQSTATREYVIPAAPEKQGQQFVHVMAKEGDRYYYYSKAYYFDNQAPTVAYSKTGVAYPLEEHDVTVTVSESYSTAGLTSWYQWVKEGEAAPAVDSQGWLELPAAGRVVIDNSSLLPGEIADFRLYVLAVDGAGNSVVSATPGSFKVSRAGEDEEPADAEAKLIYLYGDEWDGYTAVLELWLDTEDKRGYEFSISPDNGESWQKWRPYTNFASIAVPGNVASELEILVKYRTPGGIIGDAHSLIVNSVEQSEPVYAIATLSTTRPVKPATGVDIQIAPPLGIRVVASADNPSTPIRKGNVFTVRQNGFYTFDLTDLNDASRTSKLYAVVNNIDDIAPTGTIEYRVTEKTAGNVPVQLVSTSEPVVIINNNGKSTFVFTKNDSFTFMFRDEAGNEGSATATVSNIDKSAPKVSIVRSYAYGDNNSQSFGTIRDESGHVILASGVKLEVVETENTGKTIKVLDKNNGIIVRENGVYSFTVADEYGNTTVVETEVKEILSAPVEPAGIEYTFVDEDGNPLPEERIVMIDGQPYASGKVKVTLTGATTAPNAVFSGMRPVRDDNGNYTNRISSEQDGTYAYTRTFSADGSTFVGLSDLLGNASRVPITVRGLDNKAPELTLAHDIVTIVRNKADFDFRKDLGGFTVSDNVSAAENIEVSISDLDLTATGTKTVIYTATDQVGNQTKVEQKVVVVDDAGMLVFANGTLISANSGETALFGTNELTFDIRRHNLMEVDGQELVNQWGSYDVLYYSGLYREGQMKLIATKLTYEELLKGEFKIKFPKAGWYTIVVRNQERERVYATFFISKTQ